MHLVALLGVVLVLGTSGAVAQESEAGFVAEPVPGSELDPTGGFFLLEAAPGEEIQQSVGFRNDSGEPLELRLDAVDATTGQLGGASYELPEEEVDRTGAWIRWQRSTVALPAGGSAIVPFTVVVPAGARSGDHLAGLSIAAPPEESDAAERSEGQAGASIDVQTRHVIAVQVEVPGPAQPELVVVGVTPQPRPDGLYLGVDIENRGRKLTKADGVITVEDDFEHEFGVDTFIPGTSIAYPVKWTAPVAEGEYEASVELRYGDELATWEGTFRVGEATLAELGDRQVTLDDEPSNSDSPFLLVAAVTAGAVVIAGALVLRRRRLRT